MPLLCKYYYYLQMCYHQHPDHVNVTSFEIRRPAFQSLMCCITRIKTKQYIDDTAAGKELINYINL